MGTTNTSPSQQTLLPESPLPISSLAYLLALAVSANLFELILPRIPFLPWFKIGLANTFTLAVVVLAGPAQALRFALLRTLAFGFLSGSPATSFLFSGCGGLASALVMGLLWQTGGKRAVFGLMGIAVAGAITHNAIQLAVAYLLFVRNSAFLWQAPLMASFSVVTGMIVGFASLPVIRVFAGRPDHPIPNPIPRDKIAVWHWAVLPVFALYLFFVFTSREPGHFAIILGGAITAAFATRVRALDMLKAVSRFWALYVWNLIAHGFFSPGEVLWGWVSLNGLELAGLHCLRLVCCIAGSVIFLKTRGMECLLSLVTGKGGGQSIEIFSGAMAVLPFLVRTAGRMKWKTVSDFERFVRESAKLQLASRADSDPHKDPSPAP